MNPGIKYFRESGDSGSLQVKNTSRVYQTTRIGCRPPRRKWHPLALWAKIGKSGASARVVSETAILQKPRGSKRILCRSARKQPNYPEWAVACGGAAVAGLTHPVNWRILVNRLLRVSG